MKFNFEMEPSELEAMGEAIGSMINAYLENEKDSRKSRIEAEKARIETETTGTELRKAREALEKIVTVKK